MPATTLVSYCMTAKKCFFFLFVSWDKVQYLGDISGGLMYSFTVVKMLSSIDRALHG